MKNTANSISTHNAINTAITSTVTEVEEPTDLELVLELYEERKEELYQLNVKHGALLAAVYGMRSFLISRKQELLAEEQASESSYSCGCCGNNEEKEYIISCELENFTVQQKFDKLFKDLI